MIDHNSKVIFIHIPKAADQSIESFFLEQNNLNWKIRRPLMLMGNSEHEIGPPALAHLKSREYLRYCYISKELWTRYFKFTIIRNPYSRVFSTYRYFKFHKVCSFPYWIKNILPLLIEEKSYFFDDLFSYHHDDKGELMADYVAKIENLNNHWKEILNILSFNYVELPRVNKSSDRIGVGDFLSLIQRYPKVLLDFLNRQQAILSYQKAYDNKSKKIISTLYERDLDTFKYTF